MRKAVTLFCSLLVLTIPLVACGRGDIGEDCNHEGRVGSDCVDGAVCGRKAAGGGLVCLKQCSVSSDCGTGEECRSVVGTSLRGCVNLH